MRAHTLHYSRLDDRLTASRQRSSGPGSTVLEVAGDIDVPALPEFVAALNFGIDVAVTSLILDLSNTTFFSISAAQKLAEGRLRADRNGLEILLAAPPPPVRRALRATGLNDQFRTFSSVQQAVEYNRRTRLQGREADLARRFDDAAGARLETG